MSQAQEILDWQRDFRAAPLVYFTMQFYEGQLEHTGNFYDSKEAAQCEVDRFPKRRIKIHCANIHNASLSLRRWSGYPAAIAAQKGIE